jgi:hypothetical protein
MSLDLARRGRRGSSLAQPRDGHARILRLSADLADRLSRASGSTGRVHSVFTRAINIEWADGRLLTVHGPGPLRAPFAAAIARDALLRAQRPGAPVVVDATRVRLPGLSLVWSEAARIDCAIPSPPPGLHRAVIDAVRDSDRGHATGLDSRRGVAARAALSAAIVSGDAAGLVAAASDLLGLGEGLTPAGDDCLVGALAVLRATDHPALGGAPHRLTAIGRAARDRTTAVGREFVVHALAGRFSEPVLALLRARSAHAAAAAAARLAVLGATSGADTLTGMRLACRAAT